MNDFYRKCSTCRTPIAYGQKYYKCSVSTCNRKATALFFCSVPCWDAHVPDARHRDAWAEEEVAPARPNDDPSNNTLADGAKAHEARADGGFTASAATAAPARRVVSARSTGAPGTTAHSNWTSVDDGADIPRDVLVVMSKVKGYVKAKSGLRTSDGVSDPLSDHVRAVLTRALKSAAVNERTTVLARDVEAALRGENASE